MKTKNLLNYIYILPVIITGIFLLPKTTLAIENPLSVPNNKVGIHIISPSPEESSPAAELANTNGDWGYVTFIIESKDRNKDKWQSFFNDLRKRHLIPIVRIATQPEGSYWKRPYEGEEIAWADFLDSLNWPTKNRYIIIYNEPNHANEWGGSVDARDYARVLSKTIDALKTKSDDFFVINGGFDASAPEKRPNYQDQLTFMQEMHQENPGIFNKLDGWSSHSYPNPGFLGTPDDTGRGSIRTYLWEMEVLKSLGVSKKLPIFITETGWVHSEGKIYNKSYPSPETVANYYKKAFSTAWTNSQIVAVTPFLLSYQDAPFDHFSFKKVNPSSNQEIKLIKDVLGVDFPYHEHYLALQNLPKIQGQPTQVEQAELIKGEIYKSIVAGENYSISLTFKNTGQSIWNDDQDTLTLVALQGSQELGIKNIDLPKNLKIDPNQEYTFPISLQAPQGGKYKVTLNLFKGNDPILQKSLEFETEVKGPVILQVKSSLKWKNNPTGEYILSIAGAINQTLNKLFLNSNGQSEQIETKQLLPDLTYDFTLKKPYYKPKTIRQTLVSGPNTLDFGQLQPDIPSAILNPPQLWNLLPFSN